MGVSGRRGTSGALSEADRPENIFNLRFNKIINLYILDQRVFIIRVGIKYSAV